MSELTLDELAEKLLHDLSGKFEPDLVHATAMLRAAEERGRRAGIEQGFRRGVENAAQWLKISEPLRLAMHRALSDHAALAPRDSGKDPKCLGCNGRHETDDCPGDRK